MNGPDGAGKRNDSTAVYNLQVISEGPPGRILPKTPGSSGPALTERTDPPRTNNPTLALIQSSYLMRTIRTGGNNIHLLTRYDVFITVLQTKLNN